MNELRKNLPEDPSWWTLDQQAQFEWLQYQLVQAQRKTEKGNQLIKLPPTEFQIAAD